MFQASSDPKEQPCPLKSFCFVGNKKTCRLKDLEEYCVPVFYTKKANCLMCGRMRKCIKINSDFWACIACFKSYNFERIAQMNGLSLESQKQILKRI
jgi:hypothetical protein